MSAHPGDARCPEAVVSAPQKLLRGRHHWWLHALLRARCFIETEPGQVAAATGDSNEFSISERMYADEMTFVTGLELMRSEERAETDFLAWLADPRYRRLPREPAMVIGECKSYASDAFADDDIRRLKTLGEWFPGAFIVAACLKNKLSPDEVGHLRGLATWGWGRESVCGEPSRIIVLTGAELFSGSVRDGWEKAGGQLADLWLHGPASILRHLPFATQEAHLGLRKSESGEFSFHEDTARSY